MRHAVGLIAAAALAAAAPAFAQKVGEVQRGDFNVLIKARGTVLPEDVFRLKSTIEGRIEAVQASSNTWAGPREPLGFLADTELAALMDARATTSREVLEERWQKVFKPTPIRCPTECFVLRVFARPKLWVQPEAVLVEAASRLRLSGRVRPGDARWVRDGQIIQYWSRKDPSRKFEGRVERFVLDTQGDKVNPAGTFTVLLERSRYLNPGTDWEGVILALSKKSSLSVPTSALLFQNGEVFLPVRVSTGITTYDVTEILAGASDKQRFLSLEPGKAPPLQRFLPPSGLPPAPEPKAPPAADGDLLEYRGRKPVPVTVDILPPPRPKRKDDDELPSDLENP